MILNNQRRELNDLVKEWGNKKYSIPLTPGRDYGLGDFLTQEFNFRKAGAVAGFIVPGLIMYSEAPEGILAKIICCSAPYVSVIPAALSTGLGFSAGMFVDHLTGILPKSYKRPGHLRITQPKPL